jgi:hypothetical protein
MCFLSLFGNELNLFHLSAETPSIIKQGNSEKEKGRNCSFPYFISRLWKTFTVNKLESIHAQRRELPAMLILTVRNFPDFRDGE